jgi:hypothetical protein
VFAIAIVPLVVIVPPESPVPAVMLVTVPDPVADNTPPENVTPLPIVTFENPPDPLPYRIEVPDVAGAFALNVLQSVELK